MEPRPTPRPPRRRRRGRADATGARRLRRTVQVLLLALVVHLFVIPQVANARQEASLLAQVTPWLFVVALAFEAGAFVVYGRLTQVLLPVRHRPGLRTATAIVLASTGINHVVPGGAATTAAVNGRLLARLGVPPGDIAFVLTTQGLGSAVVLNVLLWLSLLVSIPGRGVEPRYVGAAVAGLLLLTLVALVVVGLRHGSATIERLVRVAAVRLRRADPERAAAVVRELGASLSVLYADRGRRRAAITLAALNWLFDAAALWVMLAAFGHIATLDGLMVAYCLANVLAAVPVTPGGLGIVEAVLIPTLVGFGTPAGVAAVGVIAFRMINFWLPIPVGVVAYIAVQRRARLEGSLTSWRRDLATLSGPSTQRRTDDPDDRPGATPAED